MPSDKHNSITAKATGLIFFTLFDVASAREMPFGIPQYVQHVLHGLTSVLLCASLLTAKSVELVVALPFVMEVVRIFHSSYFDCRGAFRTVLDSYSCVMS